MSLSLSDLPKRVLQKLNVIEIGASVDSDHDALIDSAYLEVYESLVDEGLISWDSTESIPDGRVLAVISLVSEQVADEFELGQVQRAIVRSKAADALDFLRRKAVNKADKNKTISFLDY